LPLIGVPSSSSMAPSIASWLSAESPSIAGEIV
jgi:hypothetical protein